MDGMAYLLMFILGGVALFFAVMILHWLYRLIFLEFHYGNPKRFKGEVTDMEYVPSSTRVVSTGKTTSVHTTPEKNIVRIKTDACNDKIDSSRLYQRCRIGDEVYVTYQAVWTRPRFWQGTFTKDGWRKLQVECPRDQTVTFESEKPVSRFATQQDEHGND